jgi:hypothetical protein
MLESISLSTLARHPGPAGPGPEPGDAPIRDPRVKSGRKAMLYRDERKWSKEALVANCRACGPDSCAGSRIGVRIRALVRDDEKWGLFTHSP